MLWLHIGMPKTGTTAIQRYLHDNPDLLAEHGVHYMNTGRDRGTGVAKLICHNSMAMDMNRSWQIGPQDQPAAFRQEYLDHQGENCLVSSEMFFGRDLEPLHSHLFDGLDAPVRVLIYLRRFDDFIEADYKQRSKKGRQTGGNVFEYVDDRIKRIREDPYFEKIKDALPNAEIVPRLYVREELTGQDVIVDFLSVLGVPPESVVLPKAESNRTLSRLTAEALGMFNHSNGFDVRRQRRLDRAVQALGDPRMFAKGDVLTADERREINDLLEDRNAEMLKTYFPGRDRLFPQATLRDDVPTRGDPAELQEFQYSMQVLLRLVNESQ